LSTATEETARMEVTQRNKLWVI